ncbi:sulfate adenylyltransferase [Sulfobacillus harzensis]|uniref:sulfate adenylyltransferase n=1 Tax=Sulfobacillus harzensis TaxID=2729629 RepID=A0A7Y0L5W0_9FIRM|nr:sulfate adenylyltransferase [Sulfobacillus harzensis]NMP23879.1 sulfate adenylyltransferase [Sulfobacillus harzensis]
MTHKREINLTEFLKVGPTESRDAELLAHGAYAPLTGFMNRDEYRSVLESLHLPQGAVFPLPIVLPVEEAVAQTLRVGDVLTINDGEGLKAEVRVEDLFRRDLMEEATRVFGTTNLAHPGVAGLLRQSAWCVAGPVDVKSLAPSPYLEPAWPGEVKREISRRGWRTVTFFQTRNPTHRAHEHMLKMALEMTDGIVLHPLVGPTKSDDVPPAIRMRSYRALIEEYFPKERILLATFGAAMRYAGPREAVFHGLVRKNYGATHFIVGRDAAGVGNFYGANDARLLFERLAAHMGLVPLTFDKIGYCPKCLGMASQRSCPHQSLWLSMSGTMVRDLLSQGKRPPVEIMRPEIADILVEVYRSQKG